MSQGTVDLLRRLLEAEESDLLEATYVFDAVQKAQLERKLNMLNQTMRQTMIEAPVVVRMVEINSQSQSPPVPVEVIHQVCSSRYLTVQEEGRLLLLVSKSLYGSLGMDLVWKLLCCRQWQNTSMIPSHVIDRRGYQWLFRQRAKSIKEPDRALARPRPCIGPPLLSTKNLVMLISVFNASRQEIVSMSLEGMDLESFLLTGEMNICLLDPIKLGFHSINKQNGVIDFDMFCSDFIDWRATVHILRTDRCQFAIVHETRESSWGEYDYCEDSCASTNVPTTKMALPLSSRDLSEEATNRAKSAAKLPPVEVDMGYLEFSTGTHGLDLSVVGEAYLERIRQEETYVDDRLETIKLEPTLLCFTRDFDDNKQSVELALSELRLDFWKTYRSGSAMLFNSHFESEKRSHGVTLLHLLDELNGWNHECA